MIGVCFLSERLPSSLMNKAAFFCVIDKTLMCGISPAVVLKVVSFLLRPWFVRRRKKLA